jgi:hypothetical protein
MAVIYLHNYADNAVKWVFFEGFCETTRQEPLRQAVYTV